jgi:hypothetical protein
MVADDPGDIRRDEMRITPLGDARAGVTDVRRTHRQRRSRLQQVVWRKIWKLAGRSILRVGTLSAAVGAGATSPITHRPTV